MDAKVRQIGCTGITIYHSSYGHATLENREAHWPRILSNVPVYFIDLLHVEWEQALGQCPCGVKLSFETLVNTLVATACDRATVGNWGQE